MDISVEQGHFRVLEDIARELSGDVNFPTCMDAALLIRDTLSDPFVDLPRVSAVLGTEPLISSKIVQLANSVHYNPSGRINTDIGQAVSRLGFENVRTLSLAVAMDQMLRAKHLAAYDELSRKVWSHSVHVAAIARALARHQGVVRADTAMMAGLVHDIGVFYLLYRAATYPEYRDKPEAMLDLLGIWHEGIGESLLHALGVPEDICDAVRDHDHPRPASPTPTLASTLHLANLLAGADHEWQPGDLSDADRQLMNTQAETLSAWHLSAGEEIEGFCSTLGLSH